MTSPDPIPGLAERLKAARVAWGGSQREFAHALGLHENSVALYETGRQQPSAWTIYRVCVVTGVSADWLLFGEATTATSRGSARAVAPGPTPTPDARRGAPRDT